MPGTGFGSEEQEDVFRFSDVVLDAKFDPTCWSGPCLDRQTVLDDARVVSVGKRRGSGSGLWLGDNTPLIEMAEPDASELRKIAYASGFPEGPPIRAFGIQGSPAAVVCWFPAGMKPEWPTTAEGALYAKSKSDYFDCSTIQKRADQWLAQVNGWRS